MQKKQIIYIAHPISGDIEKNLFSIRKIVRTLNLSNPNIVPFVPYYVDVVSLDDNKPYERQRGIDNDVALFKSGCIDQVWLYGDKISEGMKAEIILAKELGIPVLAHDDHMYSALRDFLLLHKLPENALIVHENYR